MNDGNELELGTWAKSLSDFKAVALAERWADLTEETLHIGELIDPLSGDLLDVVKNPRRADSPVDADVSPALARLILTAAAADPRWQANLASIREEFADEDLNAGKTLKAATLAIALLAFSTSSTGNVSSSASAGPGVEARLPRLELRSLEKDVGALIEWLTDILNSKYLTAFLNAVAMGGMVIGFRLIRRGGRQFLQDPEGKEVPVPEDRISTLQRFVDSEPPTNE